MKKTPNNDRLIDEQLATFTDNILNGTAKGNEDLSTTNNELHALQKTVLRLKNTFPEDGPSDEAIQRMRQNVIQQWKKQQESKSSQNFLTKFLSTLQFPRQKWQSQRHRRRRALTFSAAAAAFLLLLISPFVNRVGSPQLAASGQSLTFSLLILLGGSIGFAVWFYMRRR